MSLHHKKQLSLKLEQSPIVSILKGSNIGSQKLRKDRLGQKIMKGSSYSVTFKSLDQCTPQTNDEESNNSSCSSISDEQPVEQVISEVQIEVIVPQVQKTQTVNEQQQQSACCLIQ
ncbi:hypothetical protein pb186bvf_011528 [Paramecium bursaria]